MTENLWRKWPTLAKPTFLLLVVVVSYLSLAPIDQAPGTNDKFNHLIAFSVLAFWLDAAYPRTSFNWTKAIILAIYGLLIELAQGTTDYRFFSILDWFADLAGIAIYWSVIPLLKKLPIFHYRWSVMTE